MEFAGFVRAGKERSCWFSYNADYTGGRDRVPLSLTVPVAAGRYDILDWMDGLLPAPDAHAKNYSLLFNGPDTALAPLYDICSMAPYAPRAQQISEMRLAMKVGPAWTVGEADAPQAWRHCAGEVGLDPHQVLSRVEELAEALPLALADVLNEMPGQITASPSVDMLGDLASSHFSNWGRFSPTTSVDTPGPSALAPTRTEKTRCPHIGRRTNRRCIRPYRHRGPHRYQ